MQIGGYKIMTNIKLDSLQVVQEGERQIREYVNAPQGRIEIYEPTLVDANKIIELQNEQGMSFEQNKIIFDGMTMMKRVFPLLTNIDATHLSDEEINGIIDNPSVHLLIAQNIVAQILSEINKLYAENMKAELISAESVLAQSELINSIPTAIMQHAKHNLDVRERVEKVDEATIGLKEAMENAEFEAKLKEAETKIVPMSEKSDTKVGKTEHKVEDGAEV
ncbi:hypothetical protein [Bacillus sp. S0628]|uniref:hypothetical protein n=1 Tax=Bacillus sp. S0628 TaxID=2957802 RepID=UPI00209E54FB|nr:hypothetical protein [Bacillus sp. S0628]MCP1324272.1 hypothetical protein [Bacillus sp. S0628]